MLYVFTTSSMLLSIVVNPLTVLIRIGRTPRNTAKNIFGPNPKPNHNNINGAKTIFGIV